MRELMKYPLMPMPDGYLLKIEKSKGYTYLTKELDDFTMLSNAKTLSVKDRNAIFYCMKEVPATFKQIFQKMYDVSIMGKSDLLFSTDMWATRKILSRTWKGQTVVVVKNA